jgi:hypothetical protein
VTHELKTWPVFFGAVLNLTKTFEVRKDDRPYALGDELFLREFVPQGQTQKGYYTGRSCYRKVNYILKGEDFCKKGFVILGIEVL